MSVAKNFEQIRTEYLRDLHNLRPEAHTHAGSDNHVRGTALGVAVEGIYQHQDWIVNQIFADTATTANLERHAAELGITRKDGTFAAGTIRISGRPDALVPAGTALTVNGLIYRTAADVRLDSGGHADVGAVSDGIGVAYNLPQPTAAKWVSAPVGVLSDVQLLQITGGTDAESDEALLARYLYRRRKPAAGGNQYDYYVWAMEVAGVADAFVYPLRRGLGTVDVAIVASDGLPSQDVIDAVQLHIDRNRPVTAKNVLVMAPAAKTVNVRIAVKISDDVAFSAVRDEVQQAVKAYFGRIKPGTTLIRSQIESAVSQVYGVIDRQVVSPAVNVDAATDGSGIEWLRLGSLQVEQMP